MAPMSSLLSDLLFERKLLRDRVKAFESGEKYLRMKEEQRNTNAYYERMLQKSRKETEEARKETIAVRNRWMKTCDDIIAESEKRVSAAEKKAAQMEKKMLEAQRQRDEALDAVRAAKQSEYAALVALEEEREKNRALTARIRKDYTNSSKSSSMSPNHKTIPNGREKSGRKPGGQPGHAAHPRKRQEPTRTENVPPPDEYVNDPKYKRTGRLIRKQLIIMHVDTEVVEYVTPEFRNTETGQRVHAAFPHGLTDDVTYDGSIKAAAYLLNNDCFVSVQRTGEFLRNISGGKVNLSDGMICGLSRQFSKLTEQERNEIFLQLTASPVLHADFTFSRAAGRQAAVMVTATQNAVMYQGREKKGLEGVRGSPLEVYNGTLVSDHESAIIVHGERHQECLSHIKRYAFSSVQNEPDLQWNKQVGHWIRDSIHYWNEVHSGSIPYDKRKADSFIAQFDDILAKAKEEYEDVPPSDYFRDGYNLYRRMAEKPSDYTLFLTDPSVPPTNNLAERCGRPIKRKAHQVMTFRSRDGLNHFCDGMTITQTARVRGDSVYRTVASIFNKKLEA